MEKVMEEKLKSNYQSTLESIKSSTEKSSHKKSPILIINRKKRNSIRVSFVYTSYLLIKSQTKLVNSLGSSIVNPSINLA